MKYFTYYNTPVGRMLLCADKDALVGAWFEGQKYFPEKSYFDSASFETVPILVQAEEWLKRYFAGDDPDAADLILAPAGSAFRKLVWKELLAIPYGETTTYGDVGKRVASEMGMNTMSAQAVGGAVGHNPISIIIPCHRVVGADGKLTGYAGGMEKKSWLLHHESETIRTK